MWKMWKVTPQRCLDSEIQPSSAFGRPLESSPEASMPRYRHVEANRIVTVDGTEKEITVLRHYHRVTLSAMGSISEPKMARPQLHTTVYSAIAPETLGQANKGKVSVVTGAARGESAL